MRGERGKKKKRDESRKCAGKTVKRGEKRGTEGER